MENTTTNSRPGKSSISEMSRCADLCTECYKICLESIKQCLEKGGKHSDPSHINLLTDCASICNTSADFMIRGSENHVHTCKACAEICRLCAEECNSMSGDTEMEKCAEVCKRCADSCQQMSSH
ncbi:MAG TPA: four-helix bundle copper-binding protein [Oligoflexia bacterium]|nr:four-helix bundle copper-binding protein [Oligoflexia bacterium]HMP49121.1 four-helix bundle copper-binding protein [Oligoflexia bacterium]